MRRKLDGRTEDRENCALGFAERDEEKKSANSMSFTKGDKWG